MSRLPRRPAYLGPAALAAVGGSYDPTDEVSAAHETARIVLGVGRAAADPTVTARLVALVEELGLPTLVELWAPRPASTLPGALWRLYALRQWVHHDPERASREYASGVRFAQVNHVVAGPADPPGPAELTELVDRILTGVFRGDVAVAFERGAAFCRVVAAGRADLGDDTGEAGPDGERVARSAADLLRTGEELARCARLWRAGQLH